MRLLSLVTLLLYLSCTVSLFLKKERSSWMFLVAGVVINGIIIIARWLALSHFPVTTFYDSLIFFAFCTSLLSVYISRTGRSKVAATASFVSFVLLLPVLFMGAPKVLLPPSLRSYWLFIHSTLSFLGYGALSVSFVVSILYLIQDWNIRHRKELLSSFMGSLETLDRVNYISLTVGFPLLTLGIITGSIWAERAWGSYWSWDPKETWSLISWLVYAACIHQRVAIGWRGRKGAYLAIFGFLTIAFSFFVVNLIFPGLHTYAG